NESVRNLLPTPKLVAAGIVNPRRRLQGDVGRSSSSRSLQPFNLDTKITMNQELFLSNQQNKDRLISLLKFKLQENGIITQQLLDDADLLIVSTAIKQSITETFNVTVIEEDVDL
ncbi:hypothetical protein ILUMI_15069, partial [Ignelater luminosus]